MSYQIDMRDALLLYLSEECQVSDMNELADVESYSFCVSSQGQRYFLRVMFDTVDQLSIDNVRDTMESFSVSQTMSSLGDFPVVVTQSGCIFGSP